MVGRGTMATVWVARDLRVGDTVAVKLLTSLDDMARQRFRREGETATRLRSKFVVRFFDYGETTENVPFLVMELVHGLTLEAYAHRVGRMPMRHAVRFGVQIARGIAHPSTGHHSPQSKTDQHFSPQRSLGEPRQCDTQDSRLRSCKDSGYRSRISHFSGVAAKQRHWYTDLRGTRATAWASS